MSTITKAIANEVALKLTEKKRANIKKLETTLSSVLHGMILKTIPKEVVELFEKHPKFFGTRSSFQLQGNGWNYKYLNSVKQIPTYNSSFSPNAKDSETLTKLDNEVKKERQDYEKLVSEIETALFGLRTYKRVQENFPEAFELLPNKINTSLSVNLSDIRQKLN